ncbi:MAG: hypothetical protein HY916_07710 [Desulfovibrio sp.]|jgi:hypothetical protein|nr:hypothetical protein [Desulfovibrio sp.]
MVDWSWWAGVGLACAASGLGGFVLGRLSRRSIVCAHGTAAIAGDTGPALRILAGAGTGIDVMPRAWVEVEGMPYEPLARCAARQAGADGLSCEIFASSPALESAVGTPVTCFFAPVRLHGKAVNAFETVIAAVDAALEPPRLVLGPPTELLNIPRRKHPRKRVSDQRFVRVRLWAAEAGKTPLHFPDSPPDIWINAYEGGREGESAVTDISAGGLAIEVRASQVPPGLGRGSQVVIKCSLFQFKEKQFKPYWYAGEVRFFGDAPRGEGQPGSQPGAIRRIAIGFTHVGAPDAKSPQGVAWTERTPMDKGGGE